jgi:hypothetical protein
MGGLYVYADYCTGEIWGLARGSGTTWLSALAAKDANSITSFGESASGELYVVDSGGHLYHLVGYSR